MIFYLYQSKSSGVYFRINSNTVEYYSIGGDCWLKSDSVTTKHLVNWPYEKISKCTDI